MHSSMDTVNFLARTTSPAPTVTMNGTPYTVINTLAGLTNLFTPTLKGNYVLGADITWGSSYLSSAIGTFTGTFNGFGHKISSIKLTGTGLFGDIASGAVVSNIAFQGTVDPNPSNPVTAAGVLQT